MFILFGWGKQTIKLIGVAFKHQCPNCNNEEYWVLQRIITWFTLFFIPVIPYSYKYFLFCPVCERGVYLDNEQLQKIKPVAEANQQLIEGKISAEQHAAILGIPVEVDSAPVKVESKESKSVTLTATSEVKVANPKFCGDCGNSLNKNSKFCGMCGVKIQVN